MYDEKEYEEFEKRMHEKFPLMLGEGYGGFCIGKGWWPIVEALCNNIQNYLNWKNQNLMMTEGVAQVEVHQIKEKFGGLRFYYGGGDERISGMVQMAEQWAEMTCEECGKPGKERSVGWVKTLCDEHHEEREKIRANNV